MARMSPVFFLLVPFFWMADPFDPWGPKVGKVTLQGLGYQKGRKDESPGWWLSYWDPNFIMKNSLRSLPDPMTRSYVSSLDMKIDAVYNVYIVRSSDDTSISGVPQWLLPCLPLFPMLTYVATELWNGEGGIWLLGTMWSRPMWIVGELKTSSIWRKVQVKCTWCSFVNLLNTDADASLHIPSDCWCLTSCIVVAVLVVVAVAVIVVVMSWRETPVQSSLCSVYIILILVFP